MKKLSKKKCEPFCNEEYVSKIDALFRKRLNRINDLVEIIARGIAEIHLRFDELEETHHSHGRYTGPNIPENK